MMDLEHIQEMPDARACEPTDREMLILARAHRAEDQIAEMKIKVILERERRTKAENKVRELEEDNAFMRAQIDTAWKSLQISNSGDKYPYTLKEATQE